MACPATSVFNKNTQALNWGSIHVSAVRALVDEEYSTTSVDFEESTANTHAKKIPQNAQVFGFNHATGCQMCVEIAWQVKMARDIDK